MYVLGIDFGHGETSAAVVDLNINYDQTILSDNLNICGNKKSIHSVIYKNEFEHWCLDPDPTNLANSSEFRMYFKGAISRLTPANSEYYSQFISLAYNQIIQRAQEDNNFVLMANGQPNFKLYLACPSGWSNIERQEYKTFFEQILPVPVVSVIPESEAALTYSKHSDRALANQLVGKRKILIIDFGSSTIDFTLMNDGNILKNATKECGAKNVEEIIFQHMLMHENKAQQAYERLCNSNLDETSATQELVFIVRKEKEAYYGNDNRRFMRPSLDIGEIIPDASERFTCDDIRGYSSENLNNEILKKYILKIENCFSNFKEENDCQGLQAVILTGGASKMDFVQSITHQVFGLQPMMAPNPSLNISQGIAVFGYLNEKDDEFWNEHNSTRDGLSSYQERYPHGKHIEECKIRLQKYEQPLYPPKPDEEEKYWNTHNNTKEGLKSYQNKYPQGKHIEECKERLQEYERPPKPDEEEKYWNTHNNTKEGLKSYLDKYPQGKYIKECKNRLEELQKRAWMIILGLILSIILLFIFLQFNLISVSAAVIVTFMSLKSLMNNNLK